MTYKMTNIIETHIKSHIYFIYNQFIFFDFIKFTKFSIDFFFPSTISGIRKLYNTLAGELLFYLYTETYSYLLNYL